MLTTRILMLIRLTCLSLLGMYVSLTTVAQTQFSDQEEYTSDLIPKVYTFQSEQEMLEFFENLTIEIRVEQNGKETGSYIESPSINNPNVIVQDFQLEPNPERFYSKPGYNKFIGLEAPEPEAIRVMFSAGLDNIVSSLSEEDAGRFISARNSINNKEYMTPELVDNCRYLLSLNGVYNDPVAIANNIAKDLISVDVMEAEFLESTYYDLLHSLSATGASIVKEKKEMWHRKITTTKADYLYISNHDPFRLIDARVSFCNNI